MLTFCRQCRLPKGSRKPVVGPVACYRGAEVNDFRICVRGVCDTDMGDGPAQGLFIPSHRGRVDRAACRKGAVFNVRRPLSPGQTVTKFT
ncbi:hypothetical protein B9Z07_08290 [Burkholderia cenocepacia]|uniref:Uncharacterized protein n=1 Tax=Burkholderia cenocepacia TaxID=95486 RepID=A0AAD0N8D7_9BURK|nr:hypothetical protein B9Z07_08290 [Burkholderia cenocepacia]PRE36256.1 hypothetical protein C6P63_13940 [Burkholderia cenocepacia]RQU71089.1 hypothetical protein DF049_30210 [Burkholderia cenocepacia]RQU98360.1 hypothetical protein DF042_24725 [Burkholderia cenocepacia]